MKAEEEAQKKAQWAREEEEWKKRMAAEEERVKAELNARRYDYILCRKESLTPFS